MTPEPATFARERIRPTRRALLVGILGVLLYGAGANVSAGWVVVVAAVAIGAVPWAFVSAWRAAAGVRVERTLPDEATAGSDVPVRLQVTARSSAMAVVHDHLTGTVGVAAGLRDGVELEGTASLRRGELAGGDVTVELADAFGLVRATVRGSVPAVGRVLPAIPALHGTALDSAWALEAGEDATRPGDGAETVGVREYRQGDPMRRVHWRSTARRGQLVVRELAEPARARVDVVIGAGTWTVDALDRATEVAGAVAADAARHGHPTTLAADGQREPWRSSLRGWLATLPPHAGAPARPLAPVTAADAEVRVTLSPEDDGARVTLRRDGVPTDLGVLPADATGDALSSWLALRLEATVGAEVAS